MTGAYMLRLFRFALSRGKEPRMVIHFTEDKLRVEVRVYRDHT